MLLINHYTAPDAFGGTGLFAAETIPALTTIWAYNSAVDVFYTLDDFHLLPAHEQQRIARHVYPALSPDGQRGVMYSRDNDRFTNHSFSPNTAATKNGNVIALRTIAKDEEITANYLDFVPHHLLAGYMDVCACFSFLRKQAA